MVGLRTRGRCRRRPEGRRRWTRLRPLGVFVWTSGISWQASSGDCLRSPGKYRRKFGPERRRRLPDNERRRQLGEERRRRLLDGERRRQLGEGRHRCLLDGERLWLCRCRGGFPEVSGTSSTSGLGANGCFHSPIRALLPEIPSQGRGWLGRELVGVPSTLGPAIFLVVVAPRCWAAKLLRGGVCNGAGRRNGRLDVARYPLQQWIRCLIQQRQAYPSDPAKR